MFSSSVGGQQEEDGAEEIRGGVRIPPSNEEALYMLLRLLRRGGLERLPNSERDLRTRQHHQYGPLGHNLCQSQSILIYIHKNI